MKKIYSIFLLASLVFAVGCENEDDPRFQDNPETGWIEFASSSTTLQVADGGDPISIPVDFTAPINLSDAVVSYSVTPVVGGNPNGILEFAGSVVIEGNTNRAQLVMVPTANAVTELFLAGGNVVFDIELTSANRGIPIGLSDGSATTVHTVTLECGGEPAVPVPGMYTVNMRDSWGDGWQTSTSGGGDGIIVTMTDAGGNVTTAEVGMCSSFGTATGTFLDLGIDCTPGATDAVAMLEIPAGTVSAVWTYPGDWFGEISFDVVFGGSEVFNSGGPGALGPFPAEFELTYCPN